MNTIDLNTPLKGLDGADSDMSLAHVLASTLSMATEVANPLKYLDWAIKLYNEGIINVDDSDLQDLKIFVKTNKGLTVLGAGSLIKELDKIGK